MSTTSTFNSDVDDGAGDPMDGIVFNLETNATWATVRDGAGSHHATSGTVGGPLIRAGTVTDRWDLTRRAYMSFLTGDTIPASAQIVSAEVDVVAASTAANLGDLTICIVDAAFNSPTTMEDADYGRVGTTVYNDDFVTSDMPAAGGTQTFVLNAAGRAAIGKGAGAYTELGWRYENDRADSPPTWSSNQTEQFSFRFRDFGVGDAPVLRVTWSTGLNEVVTEEFTMVEAIPTTTGLNRIVDEALDFTQTVATVTGLFRAVDETLNFVEGVARVLGLSEAVDEALNLVETERRRYGVAVNETLGIAEATARAIFELLKRKLHTRLGEATRTLDTILRGTRTMYTKLRGPR